MRKIVFFLLGLLLLSCSNPSASVSVVGNAKDTINVNTYGLNVDKFLIENGEINKGEFFGTVLLKLGASATDVQRLIEASKGVFDVTKLSVGNAYEALYEKPNSITENSDSVAIDTGERKLAYFIYEKDKTANVLFCLQDSLYVQEFKKELVAEKKFAEVTINSSLWNDVIAAGASPQLALKLSDIYDCTIDFFGLQKGDSFRVMYDDLVHGDEIIGLSHIYYVEFIHDGKVFKAIRFQEQEKGSKYWNELGESLKKAFLKAPLNFTRISSGFTYARKHPVLKIVRPHTGVDYAAPSGTPVVTIGDGVVISKGWAGGGGNTLKIKHNSTYTTIYMHLKGFAKGIAVGKRVKQGELIGYVGSTGMSTGPHLDFRVHKGGKPINPLTMDSPSIEPVSKENLVAFKEAMKGYESQLDSLDAIGHFNRMVEVLR